MGRLEQPADAHRERKLGQRGRGNVDSFAGEGREPIAGPGLAFEQVVEKTDDGSGNHGCLAEHSTPVSGGAAKARCEKAASRRPFPSGESQKSQATCWIPASIHPVSPTADFWRFQISSNCCGALLDSSRMRPEKRMLAQ